MLQEMAMTTLVLQRLASLIANEKFGSLFNAFCRPSILIPTFLLIKVMLIMTKIYWCSLEKKVGNCSCPPI